jgi:hypothetical protein
MDLTPAQRDLASFYARNATLGSSERYRRATIAEAYKLGLQYEHLGDWYNRDLKVRQRKPKLIVPMFAGVVGRLDSFVWSGHRFPRAVVGATRKPGQKIGRREIGPRLEAEQAQALTSFVAELIDKGGLARAIREATRNAITTTSAAIILGTRGGYLRTHIECGKHCTPTYDLDQPRRVAALEIVYQVEKEVPGFAGTVRKQWFWYRRHIDAQRDVTYVEVPVRPGSPPDWVEDPAKTVEHKLGFCPVVWCRTLPSASDAIDGRPVIDPQLYPLFDALNYIVSLTDGSVQYGVDPQLVRTGLSEDERKALIKSVGKIWDFDSGQEAKFLELTGTGAMRGAEHSMNLRKSILEAVRVVVADPSQLTGDISGRVLEIIHQPMVELASDLRVDLGDEAFCDLIALALRLMATVIERGEDVWIPGAYEAADILVAAQLAGPWLDPPISLAWGPFFAPSLAEQQQRVSTAIDAEREGLITASTATRAIAEIFHLEDPEAERAAIEKERTARAAAGAVLFGKKPNGKPLDPNDPVDDAETEDGAEPGTETKAPTAPKPPAGPKPPTPPAEDAKPDAPVASGDTQPAAKVDLKDLQINAFDYDAGIITVNEARQVKFRGVLPPLPGGDVPVAEWKAKIDAANPAGDTTTVVHVTKPDGSKE